MTDRVLRLPIRHYQISQLYGPGMPRSGREGMHEKVLERPVSCVGLVLVHCWNLGEASGPYPIEPGVRCPGEAADWVPTAHEIIRVHIQPVLEAARAAGLTVFHLAQNTYAKKYQSYREIGADPALRAPKQAAPELCVRPRSVTEQWSDEYGERFPGPVWETHADSFDIAESVRPLDSEAVLVNGWQLNGLCRLRDIDVLLYAGFMADLCLLNIPGAIREMANTFKYRCVALRECTTAYEYEDTYEGRWMTFAAIRHIETELGYSASARDFVEAARRARPFTVGR